MRWGIICTTFWPGTAYYYWPLEHDGYYVEAIIF